MQSVVLTAKERAFSYLPTHRGLMMKICSKCNMGIGCLLDSPEVMLSAYQYLLGIA